MRERWMPENGKGYWCVLDTTPMQAAWSGSQYDIARWEAGNVFKTKDEALAASINIKSLLLSLHEDQPVTECNQLPKLTAEVFDRPDCPEWAQYAAVDGTECAYWYKNKPVPLGMYWFATDSILEKISGISFDASGWQHSLIERQEKKTLPDWCKVGEWIYTSSEQYLKINGISIDLRKIELSNGATWSKQDIIDEAVPARLRPYNAEEMKALVGKVITRKDGDVFLVTSYTPQLEEDLCAVDIDNMWVTPDDVLKDYTIDNAPCGVLEHLENGEWVE